MSGRLRKVVLVVALAVAVTITASGCALFSKDVDNFLSLMRGRSATIITYNVFGNKLDSVHGSSINISRDGTFDSVNADGSTNADSSVLLVSIGNNHMHHVGSTLLMIEDGVINVGDQLPKTVTIENNERGIPFLNNIFQQFRNLWKGRAKTIIVRSQNGSPIAIFAGNEVEYFATDVPKSTLFRIDGKYLLVYRSDYTVYDNALLS
jgi:hypothetical protein